MPSTASTPASLRASSLVARAEPAAVRVAVMCAPSMRATGSPVVGSNDTISAWWVGSAVPAFPANTVTSFADSTPTDGSAAGMTPRIPSSVRAATRGGIDARPADRSAIAAATASTIASRSRSASTSDRVRTSTDAIVRRPMGPRTGRVSRAPGGSSNIGPP